MTDITLRMSAGLSLAVAVGSGLLLLGAFLSAVQRCVVHARRARGARAASAGGELLAGHALLSGRAETDDGESAIVVHIDELGLEYHHRQGWSHTWTEESREVSARPFDLVTDDEQRVRVEPDENVFLIDRLLISAREAAHRRTRTAALDHGERCVIDGQLSREVDASAPGQGYRDSGKRWVLRPSSRTRMLIASETMPGRHERWLRFWLGAAVFSGLVLIASQSLAYAGYWRLALFGERVEARVTSLQRYTVTASAVRPDGEIWSLGDELGRNDWSQLREGDAIPFVVLPNRPAVHQAGSVGIHPFWLALFLALTLFSGLGFRRLWADYHQWFEMKRIVERRAGRLAG